MQIANQENWNLYKTNNAEGYGKAILDYAERWADLIEAKIAEGAKLEDVAEETSREADTEGITGFMYGAAVKTLFDVWAHGDRLRRWHNLDCQLQNEGERANEQGTVLNPALFNFGG